MSVPDLSSITNMLPDWLRNWIPGTQPEQPAPVPEDPIIPQKETVDPQGTPQPVKEVEEMVKSSGGLTDELRLLVAENNVVLTKRAEDMSAEIQGIQEKKNAVSALMNELMNASNTSADGPVDCTAASIVKCVTTLRNMNIKVPDLSGTLTKDQVGKTMDALRFERDQIAEKITMKGQEFQQLVNLQHTFFQWAHGILETLKQCISKIFR